jgi:Cof subfamily protein (haloacid dehalogenase superfamily)
MDTSTLKYLAIDLDGTLLNGRSQLTSRGLRAIERCVERGLYVGVCTGRSVMTCRTLLDSLPLNAPHIVQGGALIAKPHTWEPLCYGNLSPEEARVVVETVRQLGLPPVVYEPMPDGYRFYYDRRVPIPEPMQLYLDFNQLRRREVADVTEVLAGPAALVATVGKRGVLVELDAKLRQSLPGASVINECNRTHPDYGELYVLPTGFDKGTALRRVCEHLGVSPEDTMAFGDNLNDLELIQAAGVSVAVANAVGAVKEAARLVTASNDEDGVALAIEEHVLGEHSQR